jgi:hypothetical protein
MAVRLEWEGKPRQVERLSLPFQTVETGREEQRHFSFRCSPRAGPNASGLARF